MPKTYIKEKQRYTNRIVISILTLLCLLSLYRGAQIVLNPQTEWHTSVLVVVSIAAALGILWWLKVVKLKVEITEKDIKYKLYPIHSKKQSIPWEEVAECKVIRTLEAAQWSGGNITFADEKRFSLSGRNGLAIKTRKDECFFIGFQDVGKLQQIVEQLRPMIAH